MSAESEIKAKIAEMKEEKMSKKAYDAAMTYPESAAMARDTPSGKFADRKKGVNAGEHGPKWDELYGKGK